MIEKEIDLSSFESEAAESRSKKRSRSGNAGRRILVLLLVLILVGSLCFGLYSGYFSRLALQNLRQESEKLQARIQEQTAENAEKGARLETIGADIAEREAAIAELSAENAEKAAQIEGISAENAEKAAQVELLSAENASRDAELEALDTENGQKAARIEALIADNAAKDAQIEAIHADLGAKDEQIEALGENLPAFIAAKDSQIESLTAENTEKDARIDTLNAEVAAGDAQIEALSAENAEKDEQLRDLDTEIAQKEVRLDALTQQLDAVNAPLLYLESLRETPPAAAWEAALQNDPEGESDELKTAVLSALFPTVLLGKDLEETRENHLAFRIWTADGKQIGSVAFEPVVEDDSALPVWTAEESFDFSDFSFADYLQTASFIVPSDYTVYMGDQLLRPDCIEGLFSYETFSACPEIMESLPALVRYETPPFFGEPALRILNEKGQEIDPADLSERVFLDRCPEEIREQIDGFLPDFFELFLLYSADIQDAANYYYYQLKPLVLPDSPLAIRLKAAFEGLGYSTARKAVFDSVRVHSVTDLGDGRYAVDLNYVSYVTGYSSAFDPVEDDLHMLLILVLTEEGKLLAESMYYL